MGYSILRKKEKKMPCDYSEYPGNWKEIRKEILARAENKCELCGAENGKPHWKTGSKVVLTIAHLDQDKENNAKYNTRALCQRCHNIIDLPYRVKRREEAKRKKDIREYREVCNLILKEIYNNSETNSLKKEGELI